jgi:hypothetical protein
VYRGVGVGGAGTIIGGGGGLVVTGSPVATWTVLAGILLVTGMFLMRVARQRRSR